MYMYHSNFVLPGTRQCESISKLVDGNYDATVAAYSIVLVPYRVLPNERASLFSVPPPLVCHYLRACHHSPTKHLPVEQLCGNGQHFEERLKLTHTLRCPVLLRTLHDVGQWSDFRHGPAPETAGNWCGVVVLRTFVLLRD
jgi:hypothetical protein